MGFFGKNRQTFMTYQLRLKCLSSTSKIQANRGLVLSLILFTICIDCGVTSEKMGSSSLEGKKMATSYPGYAV